MIDQLWRAMDIKNDTIAWASKLINGRLGYIVPQAQAHVLLVLEVMSLASICHNSTGVSFNCATLNLNWLIYTMLFTQWYI